VIREETQKTQKDTNGTKIFVPLVSSLRFLCSFRALVFLIKTKSRTERLSRVQLQQGKPEPFEVSIVP
jgi:hypothetical protein